MAARLLLRRFLVGNSEYGLLVESMGTLGGTQNRKCRKRVGWKCQGTVPVRAGSFVNEVHFSGQSPHAIVNQCNYTNVTSRYNKNCLFEWMVFRNGTNQLLRL